jgi:hypothetical protein
MNTTMPDWFVSDNALTSYVNPKNDYKSEFGSEEIKWFNFNISTPAETEQEAKEREMATRQQIQLGILRVQQAPPSPQPVQQSNGKVIQPPQHALDPEIAKAMECRITPAFVSMLDGKPVDMQSIPEPTNNVGVNIIDPPKNKIDQMAEQLLNANKNSEKYKFSLNGKQKIGKNDPCPCGSGQKFKRCHGR